jgi:hypothetical protein
MKKRLSVRSFVFRSYDELNNYNTHFCDVTITIELMEYPDEKKYYYINYKYDFSKTESSNLDCNMDEVISDQNTSNQDTSNEVISDQDIINKNKSHPFYEFPYVESESYIGEIICNNEMTEKMIEYLLMPDEELQKVCGVTTPQKYRKLIMASLSQFWD